MGIFAAFQLVLLMRKLSSIVFEDGLCCFARGGVKKNTMAATRFCYAGYLLGQNPHAEAAVAGTKTNWLVCPFTSFDAAQSSRMMSVLVVSKKKLARKR